MIFGALKLRHDLCGSRVPAREHGCFGRESRKGALSDGKTVPSSGVLRF